MYAMQYVIEVPGIRYQVLHLSKPYLREIL